MRKKVSNDFNQPAEALTIPMVVERDGQSERSYDIFSLLLKQRIMLIAGPVTTESMTVAVAQLLVLAADPQSKVKGIDMYIMSPGGEVLAGNALLDTMNYLKDQGITIRTTAMGMAMSMGSAILVNGSPGERRCLPSTSIMLHQPSGGAQGKVDDMVNRVAEADFLKRSMAELYKLTTKMDDQTINNVLNSPDYYMQGEEAKKLGVVDEVAYPSADHMKALAAMQKEMNNLHERQRSQRIVERQNIFAPK
jgi:ATP-dependent Clp protease protease subunit